MNGYFVRHAVYFTLMTGAGALLWIIFCFALGLPFHPWSSSAIGIFVAVALYCFAALDRAAMNVIGRLRGLWSVMTIICVGLAAAFGARGGPFPIWALVPVIVCLGLLAAAIAWFGARSIIRLLMGRADLLQATGDPRSPERS
jgi:hypothetical protein